LPFQVVKDELVSLDQVEPDLGLACAVRFQLPLQGRQEWHWSSGGLGLGLVPDGQVWVKLPPHLNLLRLEVHIAPPEPPPALQHHGT
jgi:hypothetical protein